MTNNNAPDRMNHIQKLDTKSPPVGPTPNKKWLLLSLGIYDETLCAPNGTDRIKPQALY
jgi:hypothetical protein